MSTMRLAIDTLSPRQDGEFFLLTPELEKVQKKLAKSARKGGSALIEVVSVERCNIERNTGLGWQTSAELVTVHRVRLSGALYQVEGHRLVASLEHTPAGNLVRKAPGFLETDLTAFRETGALCEHCNTRRARKDTFVLLTPDGRMMQVGRNCLADFLPKDELDMIAAAIEAWQLLSDGERTEFEEDSFGGFGRISWDLLTVLSHASRAVSLYGFRKSSKDGSTREAVAFSLGQRPRIMQADWTELQPEAADVEAAKACLAWIEGLPGSGDYEHNLRTVAALGYVDSRSLGLAVSAVAGYRRVQGEAAERAVKVNEHFGTEKARLELSLTLIRVSFFDTQFGTKGIYSFEDSEGRAFVWKTTTGLSAEPGAALKGACSIKGHTEYKGRKQTELTRCKLARAS